MRSDVPPTDKVFASFLNGQFRDGMALSAASDLLDLVPLGPPPPRMYVASFHCRNLQKDDSGEVVIGDRCECGIVFPPNYLRRVEPARVLHWRTPKTFLPNVRFPFICIGPIYPGTHLVELIFRVFDVASGKRMTVNEFDALNPEACEYARNHPERFPSDERPLKRRRIHLTTVPATKAEDE